MLVRRSVMKIVVAGSRDYTNYEEAVEFIEQCIQELAVFNDIIILSGGCRGADMLGERYANEYGYKTEEFPAQWDKFGEAAGIIRNKEMADNPDAIICFLDGKSKGTKALIDYTRASNKTLFIKHV